jgi:hypothetical protein
MEMGKHEITTTTKKLRSKKLLNLHLKEKQWLRQTNETT